MVKTADLAVYEVMNRRLKIASPDLSESWLKSFWPEDLGKSAFKDALAAIKAYKSAKRGTDSDALKQALKDLRGEADTLIGRMKQRDAQRDFPTYAGNAIKALTAFQRTIDDAIKEVDRLNKPGTATQVVYNISLTKLVSDEVARRTGLNLAALTKPECMIELKLLTTFVNELKAVNAGAQLHSQISALVNYEAGRCARVLVEDYQEMRARQGSMSAFCSSATNAIGSCQERINQQIHKICTSVLRNIKVGAEMERAYKKSITTKKIKLAVNTTFAAGSVAGLFFPGTTAFAAYGLARSAASVAQEAASLWSGINDKVSVLNYHLAVIEKKAKEGATKAEKAAKTGKKAGRETVGTVVNTALGVDIVPTVATAKSLYKDLNRQVAHVRFKHQELVKQVHLALGRYEIVATQVADNYKKMNGKVDPTKLEKEVYHQTKIILKEVEDLVNRSEKIMRPLNNCETQLMSIERRIKEMSNISKVQKGVNITSEVLITLGGLAAGGVVDAATFQGAAGEVITQTDRVLGVANSATALGKELYERGKQTGEALNM